MPRAIEIRTALPNRDRIMLLHYARQQIGAFDMPSRCFAPSARRLNRSAHATRRQPPRCTGADTNSKGESRGADYQEEKRRLSNLSQERKRRAGENRETTKTTGT